MNQTWLKVFAVLMGGGLVKTLWPEPMVWVGIDLVVLGGAYQVLKRDAAVDVPKSMKLLASLTAVNVLVDLGMVEAWLGNFAVLGLVGWMLFQNQRSAGRGRRQRHKWNK